MNTVQRGPAAERPLTPDGAMTFKKIHPVGLVKHRYWGAFKLTPLKRLASLETEAWRSTAVAEHPLALRERSVIDECKDIPFGNPRCRERLQVARACSTALWRSPQPPSCGTYVGSRALNASGIFRSAE